MRDKYSSLNNSPFFLSVVAFFVTLVTNVDARELLHEGRKFKLV
jgi:hypothetical protein